METGSEFNFIDEEQSTGITFPDASLSCLVFSGRTAIETVIKNTSIRKVMLPSYCCDSMIVPFRDANISCCFYDVYYKDGFCIELQIPDDVDAVLWCNYFGFRITMPDMSGFKNRGGIIIEDITHSFYSDKVYDPQSDYLVASLRKWEPLLCGGYCAGLKSELNCVPIKKPPGSYEVLKRTAMKLKSKYLISGEEKIKLRYLSMFKEANEWLADNYKGLLIDPFSENYLDHVDHIKHREIRRSNAKVLSEGLKEIDSVNLLFNTDDMDCPLFVPIVIESNRRNKIRQKLTDNKIYCPVHWPKPNADCSSNLYDMELSLICDQRYDSADMNRIVSVLKESINQGE